MALRVSRQYFRHCPQLPTGQVYWDCRTIISGTLPSADFLLQDFLRENKMWVDKDGSIKSDDPRFVTIILQCHKVGNRFYITIIWGFRKEVPTKARTELSTASASHLEM